MKLELNFILVIALLAAASADVIAQSKPDPALAAEDLRAQLIEVQTKEADLQARAQQLEEALKPENIERSLAGVGSTKPEELRELRRRQLTIERDGVNAQLKILATSRERLESAIRAHDARAYQQSADGPPVGQNVKAEDATIRGWLIASVAGLAGILVAAFAVVMIRRRV